eukprot:1532660-Prymnesium_polylepis.1
MAARRASLLATFAGDVQGEARQDHTTPPRSPSRPENAHTGLKRRLGATAELASVCSAIWVGYSLDPPLRSQDLQ